MLVTVAHSVSTLTPFLSVSSRFDAGSTRNLRLRTLYLQLRAMGSNKGGESLNQSISINDPSGDDAAKENGTGDQNAALSMAAKYESMTVQELRTMLGNFGASAKGRKSELISRLSSLSDGNVSGETFLKLDRVTDVEASSVKKCKRKQQPLVDDDETEEVDVDAVVTNLKTVAKTTKVSGKSLPAKRKLSVKATTTTAEATVVLEESVYESEPWTRFAHKKPLKDWFAYNPKVMRPPHLGSDVKSMKLISWNVNGLRALLKMEGFSALELAQREDFDILCLQETKLQDKDVESVKHMLEGYDNSFWTCSVSKRGYSGTAIISRVKPLSVSYGLGISDHDSEGRLVTAEYESFYLLSAYVPNSGDGLKRLPYRVEQWDPSLSSHIKELEKSKPVILTGDLNCAHQEIDIYNPAGNKRSAGFTMEERQSFETNFLAKGFVDTFRKQHPNAVGYTYWGYRHGGRKTNRGWRLDYFLVSQSMADNVHDSYILPDVNGSDHCPIGLVLRL